MKLHKHINKKLLEVSHEEVIKKMGYGSLKIGLKTLNDFLLCKNVYVWLKYGYYDLKYTSESFVWKLVEVLDIPNDVATQDIEKAKKRCEAFFAMKDPYLRAEMNFKRNGKSMIALMYASVKGRISIHKESLVYKNDKDIFEEVGRKIRTHYKKTKGELPMFGKIKYYLYDHTDGKSYKFTIDGNHCNENIENKEDK